MTNADALQSFSFNHKPKIVAGLNSTADIDQELSDLGCERPLIITDEQIREVGLLDSITASLEDSGMSYDVFDNVVPNPRNTSVQEAASTVEEGDRDALIAVGGGSSIDTAKATSMIASHGGEVEDYQGMGTLEHETLPLITVPTTVGTGSEVTPAFVITHAEKGFKMITFDEKLFASVAMLDPTLLESLPPQVTAATGMDSLTQAIECYITKGANPITDALAISSVELISDNLREAVAGTDLQAKMNMQIATTMEGMAFHNAGLGLVHGMANTVGGRYDTAHGRTNAILLPYVLEFNMIAAPNKYEDMARAMGVPTEGLSTREVAERFVDAIKQLSEDIGIPSGLREIGVEEEAIPDMTEEAYDHIDSQGNPREFIRDDIRKIYEKAY